MSAPEVRDSPWATLLGHLASGRNSAHGCGTNGTSEGLEPEQNEDDRDGALRGIGGSQLRRGFRQRSAAVERLSSSP